MCNIRQDRVISEIITLYAKCMRGMGNICDYRADFALFSFNLGGTDTTAPVRATPSTVQWHIAVPLVV